MPDGQLKKKVYDLLKKGYFSGTDDAVDVSDGPEDSIHLVIVSRKFDGKRLRENNDFNERRISNVQYSHDERNENQV